ncbi:MAG: hypothetical protein WC080_01230 [Patescibacteria group bacterium]|jgi:flagellar basal body-associated protein FliL
MPEDQKNTPEAPAPAQTAAPQPTQAAPAKKKTNVGLIILIVVLVLVVVGGGISYGIYRFVKNRVHNAVSDVIKDTTGVNTDTTNIGTDTNDYSQVQEVTPSDSLSISVNAEIKPILTNLFGGAKLSLWSSATDSATLYYTTKNEVNASKYSDIENAFVNAGYTKTANYNTSDSFSAYFDKGDISMYIVSSGTHMFDVVVSKISTDTSAE